MIPPSYPQAHGCPPFFPTLWSYPPSSQKKSISPLLPSSQKKSIPIPPIPPSYFTTLSVYLSISLSLFVCLSLRCSYFCFALLPLMCSVNVFSSSNYIEQVCIIPSMIWVMHCPVFRSVDKWKSNKSFASHSFFATILLQKR